MDVIQAYYVIAPTILALEDSQHLTALSSNELRKIDTLAPLEFKILLDQQH